MMTGQVPQQPQSTAGNPFLDNPYAKAFQEMMAGFGAAATAAQQPAPAATKPAPAEKPETPASSAQTASLMEMMNSMFDSGLEVQKSYQKNMEAIFDGYLKSAPSAATNGSAAGDK